MTMGTARKTATFNLEAEQVERLHEISEEANISLSQLAREAFKKLLAQEVIFLGEKNSIAIFLNKKG